MKVEELEQQYDIWSGNVNELQARLGEWINIPLASFIFAYRVSRALKKVFPDNAVKEEWPSPVHGWVCIDFFERAQKEGSIVSFHNHLACIIASHATKRVIVDVKCGDKRKKTELEGEDMAKQLIGILGAVAVTKGES